MNWVLINRESKLKHVLSSGYNRSVKKPRRSEALLFAGVDYSVKIGDGGNPLTAYDGNGNILSMQQKGLNLNISALIDRLNYSSLPNSNKLQAVMDTAND